jgi:hypothetical protein
LPDLYLLEMRSVIAPRPKSCSSLCPGPHIVVHSLVPLHLHFELQLQLQILSNIEGLLGCYPWQEPQCGLSTWWHYHMELMACLRQKLLWWWNDPLSSSSNRISHDAFCFSMMVHGNLRTINWLLLLISN